MKSKLVLLIFVGILFGCKKSEEVNKSSADSIPVTAKNLWGFQQEKDELTDVLKTSAQIKSENQQQTLMVRCEANKLSVLVDFRRDLQNALRPVTYRFGTDPHKSSGWGTSKNQQALFAPLPTDFSRELMKNDRLLLETQDMQGNAFRASFDLSVDSAAVAKVLIACGRTIDGLDSKISGLRKNSGLELENWGPKNIELAKRILAEKVGFSGDFNSELTPEFALLAQSFSDKYIERCIAGKLREETCDYINVIFKYSGPDSSLIRDILEGQAGTKWKKELNNLQVNEQLRSLNRFHAGGHIDFDSYGRLPEFLHKRQILTTLAAKQILDYEDKNYSEARTALRSIVNKHSEAASAAATVNRNV